MLEQARLAKRHQEYPVFGAGFTGEILWSNTIYDLIVVSRVLHHMPDLDGALLPCFHHHLRENGQVLIADFIQDEYNHHGLFS